MCGGGCSGTPGATRTAPAVFGAAGGPVRKVKVVQSFFGLWQGTEVWVTGLDADRYIDAGLLKPVP